MNFFFFAINLSSNSVFTVAHIRTAHVYKGMFVIVRIANRTVDFQNTFKTPVYVTSQRRNAMGVGLVFEADLHSTEHPSHWVLQGVCLILNTD